MIPQALTYTGEYAHLWSHVKSMAHALHRVEKASSKPEISALDYARLAALVNFLRIEIEPEEVKDLPFAAAYLAHKPALPAKSAEFDLRPALKGIPAFEEWLKPQKLSVKEKVVRLAANLEAYLNRLSTDDNFVLSEPPRTEFSILSSLLENLILRAESILLS